MKISDIAKKYEVDEKEFEEFVVKSEKISTRGTSEKEIDYADIEYAVNLYFQNGGHKMSKSPDVVPSSSNQEVMGESINSNELLEQIANNVKKATFWIRFWSILSLISGIIIILIVVNGR